MLQQDFWWVVVYSLFNECNLKPLWHINLIRVNIYCIFKTSFPSYSRTALCSDSRLFCGSWSFQKTISMSQTNCSSHSCPLGVRTAIGNGVEGFKMPLTAPNKPPYKVVPQDHVIELHLPAAFVKKQMLNHKSDFWMNIIRNVDANSVVNTHEMWNLSDFQQLEKNKILEPLEPNETHSENLHVCLTMEPLNTSSEHI